MGKGSTRPLNGDVLVGPCGPLPRLSEIIHTSLEKQEGNPDCGDHIKLVPPLP